MTDEGQEQDCGTWVTVRLALLGLFVLILLVAAMLKSLGVWLWP